MLLKPWNDTDAPQEIFDAFGMIGPEERRCFYWLARNCLSGEGAIVDAGAFVGASTLCFAAGAAAAGHTRLNGRPILHAYDYFAALDAYVADAISKQFRPIKQGEAYLDIFEAQTSAYAGMIEAHSGDFLRHRWNGDAIDILFIDVAKRAKLNSHAIGEFFPHLVPGRSIVVHQDYYHCWHPYIHISMEYFGDAFELVDEHVEHQSRVWRLVKPLPEDKIAHMRNYDLEKGERIALLDRLIARSSDDARPMLEVTRIWQRCMDKDFAEAKRDLRQLHLTYGAPEFRHKLFMRQAAMIERDRKDLLAAAEIL